MNLLECIGGKYTPLLSFSVGQDEYLRELDFLVYGIQTRTVLCSVENIAKFRSVLFLMLLIDLFLHHIVYSKNWL